MEQINWNCKEAEGCDIAYRSTNSHRIRNVRFRNKSNLISRTDVRHEYLGDIFTSSEWGFIHKPEMQAVYTQEMYDNKDLPVIGMMIEHMEFGACEIIGINKWEEDTAITFSYIDDGDRCGAACWSFFTAFNPVIKTDTQKTIDEIDRSITNSYNSITDTYKNSSEFKTESKLLLADIISGKFEHIKYTGDK